MMDYFKQLSEHCDQAVREAATQCMECYVTPRWRSRTMRKLLGNLSWALYNYTKAQYKPKANTGAQREPEPVPCKICDKPTVYGELCDECAKTNDYWSADLA